MRTSLTVEASEASSMISTRMQSFTTTRCRVRRFECRDDYVWQWTLISNFGGQQSAHTHSTPIVCTNEPRPCCLPGAFSDPKRPHLCDREPLWPNTCDNRCPSWCVGLINCNSP